MDAVNNQPVSALAGWFGTLKTHGVGWGFLVLSIEGDVRDNFVQIISDEDGFALDHPLFTASQRGRREEALRALDAEHLVVQDRASERTLLANLPDDAEKAAAIVTRFMRAVFGGGTDARYRIALEEFPSGPDEQEERSMGHKETVFVVSRLNWRPRNRGAWQLGYGTARLVAFSTRAEADAECARREANARRRVNPFRCGRTLGGLTTLPEPIFLDWVRDTGLDPPVARKDQPEGWAEWWDTHRRAMNAEQYTRLWEGLNQLQFFRVDARQDRPSGMFCWGSWRTVA